MITISFPINPPTEDMELIADMQRVQSSMIRSVYNMAVDGMGEKEIRTNLNSRFHGKLDSWYKQSAVYLGKGMVTADTKANRIGRVFGGKNNFIARTEGKLTHGEWKESRLLPLYIIGESPQGGNRKFSFSVDSIIFKPYKGRKITFAVPSLHKNYARKWCRIVELASENKAPITVSLTKTHIFLTFDDGKLRSESIKPPIETRYAGVDMNPNYIGVSVFDSGKLIATKMFDMKDLTGKGKSESKIKHETREIASHIGRYLKHLRVANVYTEELNFKPGDAKKGKNFNRLTKNQWKRSDFTSALSTFYKSQEINAAYSSTIGNVINPSLPDPIAASAEIARRGYECYKLKSKKFYPELPTLSQIEDRWKKTDLTVFGSWKELHDWLKNLKLRYRVPVPERTVFRFFRSARKSRVYELDNFSYS